MYPRYYSPDTIWICNFSAGASTTDQNHEEIKDKIETWFDKVRDILPGEGVAAAHFADGAGDGAGAAVEENGKGFAQSMEEVRGQRSEVRGRRAVSAGTFLDGCAFCAAGVESGDGGRLRFEGGGAKLCGDGGGFAGEDGGVPAGENPPPDWQ